MNPRFNIRKGIYIYDSLEECILARAVSQKIAEIIIEGLNSLHFCEICNIELVQNKRENCAKCEHLMCEQNR